jgi:hypothetical protein
MFWHNFFWLILLTIFYTLFEAISTQPALDQSIFNLAYLINSARLWFFSFEGIFGGIYGQFGSDFLRNFLSTFLDNSCGDVFVAMFWDNFFG